MAQTFDQAYRDEIERTAMVTANAHSETVLRERNMPPQYVAAPFTRPAWDPVHPDALAHLSEV